MRPVLSPAARRLWRGRETLQIGRSSTWAVVVEGLDATRQRVLPLLDGTRTRAQVVRDAAKVGCQDADELLGLLERAGVLLDADDLLTPALDQAERDRLSPDLASLSLVRGTGAGAALLGRRAARVVVHGAGRVGAPLAALLSAAGVGTVDVRDEGLASPADTGVGGLGRRDVGRPRGRSVTSGLRTLSSARAPALVVLTDDSAEQTAAVLLRAGTPHLLARVEERTGIVGPLVLPGVSACLHCQDLVRSAIDPEWPAIAAQLSQVPRGIPACDGVLAVAVASQAALQVLELLEGGSPASVGGSLELELPGWRWRRRTWPQHPGCPCAWVQVPAAPTTTAAAAPDAAAARARLAAAS